MSRGVTFFHLYLPKLKHEIHIATLKYLQHDLLQKPTRLVWRQQLLSAATIMVPDKPSTGIYECFRNIWIQWCDEKHKVCRLVGFGVFFVDYYLQESSTSWWKDFFSFAGLSQQVDWIKIQENRICNLWIHKFQLKFV